MNIPNIIIPYSLLVPNEPFISTNLRNQFFNSVGVHRNGNLELEVYSTPLCQCKMNIKLVEFMTNGNGNDLESIRTNINSICK